MKTHMIILKLHKLCPMWKWHRDLIWNFAPEFRIHWHCKYCPLLKYRGVGRAYRITLNKEE